MPEVDKADYEAFQAFKAQQAADEAAQAEADKPDEYYVHLADGQVVTLSGDDLTAAGTHYDGVAVIASYRVGA